MKAKEALVELQALANPEAAAGMARYGINPANTYGISIPKLRQMAKKIGRDHELAQELWASGIHEARILAGMVDEPGQVTADQMETWAAGFDSWDVCDQCCNNLFAYTHLAYTKALEWSGRPEEFVKRAGFVLMATQAVHDKLASDDQLAQFLPIIGQAATDDRNFVKKAVNWALRQIGKRNLNLNRLAVAAAQEIKESDSKAARWVANDALRELSSPEVQQRLAKRSGNV